MPEKRGRHAKVLAEHLGRYVLEPVGDQERVFFVKVAIVKDQKEFAAVWIETLDRVWNPRREKPEIADADIVDEVAPLRVDGGNAGGAVKHVRPLGDLMPMRLAHAARVEPHIWQRAMIGGGRHQQIGILPVARDIARTRIGAPMAGPLRLRYRFIGLRACDGCRSQQAATSRGRRQYVATRNGIHRVPLWFALQRLNADPR